MAASTVYTIGFTRKNLRTFVDLLKTAGVDAVIDIRLRPDSQLSGYAKSEDLAYVLELLGIDYERQPSLAPTAGILDGYRKDRNWDHYVEAFTALMRAREVESVGRDLLSRRAAPCLLCSEATAEQCHRRLIAEYWAERLPGITVVHL